MPRTCQELAALSDEEFEKVVADNYKYFESIIINEINSKHISVHMTDGTIIYNVRPNKPSWAHQHGSQEQIQFDEYYHQRSSLHIIATYLGRIHRLETFGQYYNDEIPFVIICIISDEELLHVIKHIGSNLEFPGGFDRDPEVEKMTIETRINFVRYKEQTSQEIKEFKNIIEELKNAIEELTYMPTECKCDPRGKFVREAGVRYYDSAGKLDKS